MLAAGLESHDCVALGDENESSEVKKTVRRHKRDQRKSASRHFLAVVCEPDCLACARIFALTQEAMIR